MKERELTSGVLSIEPTPAGNCRVVALSRKAGRRIEINAKVFVPSIPGIPVENLKCRVTTMSFQAILAPPKCTFSFKLDPDLSYEFNDLVQNVAFMDACTESDVRIEFWKGSQRFVSITPYFYVRAGKFSNFLSNSIWRINFQQN